MSLKEHVYSPAAYSYGLLKMNCLPNLSHDEWLFYDKVFFDMCSILYILEIPGYATSRGINIEKSWAIASNKSIIPFSPKMSLGLVKKHNELLELYS